MGSKKSLILFTLAVAAFVILVNTSEGAPARDLAETTSTSTSNKINAAKPATKNTIGLSDAKNEIDDPYGPGTYAGPYPVGPSRGYGPPGGYGPPDGN